MQKSLEWAHQDGSGGPWGANGTCLNIGNFFDVFEGLNMLHRPPRGAPEPPRQPLFRGTGHISHMTCKTHISHVSCMCDTKTMWNMQNTCETHVATCNGLCLACCSMCFTCILHVSRGFCVTHGYYIWDMCFTYGMWKPVICDMWYVIFVTWVHV